jgi:hypothetical protein
MLNIFDIKFKVLSFLNIILDNIIKNFQYCLHFYMIYNKGNLKCKFQEDKYNVKRDPCSKFIVLNIREKPVHSIQSQSKETGSVQ